MDVPHQPFVEGLIARYGEEGIVNTIVSGAADSLGAALMIVVARGITVVMKNTYITDDPALDGTRGLRFLQRRIRGAGGFAIIDNDALVHALPTSVAISRTRLLRPEREGRIGHAPRTRLHACRMRFDRGDT